MFAVGEVVETKMAFKSGQKGMHGELLPIGTIEIKMGSSNKTGLVKNNYAAPGLTNFRVPLIGEQVLIFVAPSVVSSAAEWTGPGIFYFSPYNSTHNFSLNQFPKLYQRGKTNTNSPSRLADDEQVGYTTKKSMKIINPLQIFEGDDLWQGRNGQSIRFSKSNETVNSPGTGVYEKSPTWKGGNDDPILIINLRTGIGNGLKYDIEDISKDPSNIYLTTKQKLNSFKPGFNKNSDVKQIGNYSSPQIIINSGRIVINSKDDKLFLIGKDKSILTAKKVLFQSDKHKVDLDDLMDYIKELCNQVWRLTSAQAMFTTAAGPTGPSTNVAEMTKHYNATFNQKFKMP